MQHATQSTSTIMPGVSCRGPTFRQAPSLHEVSSASHYNNLVNVIRIASSFPLLSVRSLLKHSTFQLRMTSSKPTQAMGW